MFKQEEKQRSGKDKYERCADRYLAVESELSEASDAFYAEILQYPDHVPPHDIAYPAQKNEKHGGDVHNRL